jgi:hypothetical protein
VLRHFVVGSIEIRLIAAGAVDTGLRVIRDYELRGSVEVIEGGDVAGHPVWQIPAQGGLGEGVGAGAQYGYEEKSRRDVAGQAAVDGHRRPGPIDECLFAGTMFLPHHDASVPMPLLVQLAETTDM